MIADSNTFGPTDVGDTPVLNAPPLEGSSSSKFFLVDEQSIVYACINAYNCVLLSPLVVLICFKYFSKWFPSCPSIQSCRNHLCVFFIHIATQKKKASTASYGSHGFFHTAVTSRAPSDPDKVQPSFSQFLLDGPRWPAMNWSRRSGVPNDKLHKNSHVDIMSLSSWIRIHRVLVGGLNPSEKYESQLGWLFPICGKIKNVPNHQPEFIMI